MPTDINPFHELYVTETARPDEFIRLFSPLLVQHALILFQPGNVVVRGTQGSGKSMLLNLLKPETRCAYNNAKIEFPVPQRMSRFVGAGINLTRSGALDIGQRPIHGTVTEDERLFPLYFADFVNYWIIRDVIRSVQTMAENRPVFADIISADRLDSFASDLCHQECWFGYLDGHSTIQALTLRIEERISVYRAFHMYNIRELPDEIVRTKTNIGEPLSQAAESLRRSRLVGLDVPLFVRIDQHETLCRSDDLRPSLGNEYRRIINKALSTRDPRISYRIGTRRYAWQDDLKVFGSGATLEILRDYRVVELDDLLRRKENPSTWIFPAFAEDVFRRRLDYAGFRLPKHDTLRAVMGSSAKPGAAAREYVGTTEASRALKLEPDWPQIWRTSLVELFATDPLAAKLAEAWVRQKGDLRKRGDRLNAPPPKSHPWNKVYWRKERVRQAIFQLAARCAQRPVWAGADQILGLSMGGTLVLISVCQHVWDAFMRSQLGLLPEQRRDPVKEGIPQKIQAIGIQTASSYWYDKIIEQPGGSERRRFLDVLGRIFYEQLIADRAMSYPGHNGFSLVKDEFEKDPEVFPFLGDAVDFGDLFDAQHTTKHKDGRQRIKWYLSPILSPYFKVPESHVKEPMYLTVHTVREWLAEAGVLPSSNAATKSKKQETSGDDRQLSLLPEN